MAGTTYIPLFPLNTVLFPGGLLALRIFEPRYLEMVSACMKESSGFGVCLILSGNEVGTAAKTYDVGNYVRIVDWTLRDDGLLGITVESERRFRIRTSRVQPNQLIRAEVELLDEPPLTRLPECYAAAVQLLRETLARTGGVYAEQTANYDDPLWVGGRLAELLPIEADQKQYLLQLDDPIQRLERVCAMWDCLREE